MSDALTCHRHAVAAILLLGLLLRATAGENDAVDRGREVYIAEGCINCHSQYIRPKVAADVERWGPAASLPIVLESTPPLLGNRRQGPDLSNVGIRRSPAWNRLHLIAPRTISPGSVMPTYAYLFGAGDQRGPDLLAYLSSLGSERLIERLDFVAHWQPGEHPIEAVAPNSALFLRLCSACHGSAGRGDGVIAHLLETVPSDWAGSPKRRPASGEDELLFLCRLIKFGLPGTAMAGHEYLRDDEIAGLARVVQNLETHFPPTPSQ